MTRKFEWPKTESELLAGLDPYTAHADEIATIQSLEWGELAEMNDDDDLLGSGGQPRDSEPPEPSDALRRLVTSPTLPTKLTSSDTNIDWDAWISDNPSACRRALPVVSKILTQWKLEEDAQARILGMTKDELRQSLRSSSATQLSESLLKRMSYILNIHENSKTLFSDSTLFLNSRNFNEPFEGASPVEFISGGSLDCLAMLFNHTQVSRQGGW